MQRQSSRGILLKGVLKNFTKFTGKHLCQSLFLNKVAGRPATLLKKRLWNRCFLVNFVKFFRTPFRWLLLIMISHATSLKQTYFFFAYFLEYVLLFLDDHVDEESESFSKSKSLASGCCLAFA